MKHNTLCNIFQALCLGLMFLCIPVIDKHPHVIYALAFFCACGVLFTIALEKNKKELTDKEINEAFKQQERTRLKNKLKDLDNN